MQEHLAGLQKIPLSGLLNMRKILFFNACRLIKAECRGTKN